jgi:hypothetical protein
MKYDIIYDDKGHTRWMSEKTTEIYSIIKSWVGEYAEEYGKKPTNARLLLGLNTWELLRSHPQYLLGTLTIYNLDISVIGPYWELNNNYIELNLE